MTRPRGHGSVERRPDGTYRVRVHRDGRLITIGSGLPRRAAEELAAASVVVRLEDEARDEKTLSQGTSFPVVPGDLSRFGDLNPRPAVYETGVDPWSFAAVGLVAFPPGNDVFQAGLAAGFAAGLALAGLVAA